MEEFSDVRFKQRAVIEFLAAEKVPLIEIHRRMQAIYGDQCVDVSTVRRWVRRYQQINTQQFHVLPTQCIYVFCMDLRKKHPLFPYTALTDWIL